VCVCVCVCVWGTLPDLNKMEMEINKHNTRKLCQQSRRIINCIKLNSFHTYNYLHCRSKRLDRGVKHEHNSKLIHITAHLLLGVRSRGVCILLVRSLPTDTYYRYASFGPQFTGWSVRRSASPQVCNLPQPTIPHLSLQ